MTRYQLAKLIAWVGGIDTRKRMQKLVYMLQAAGCDFEADYFLHRFGPYSQELARLTDEMVSIGLLEESATPNQVGQQFSYQLTERGNEQVANFEKSDRSPGLLRKMRPFEPLAKELATNDLRKLEVASTIAYYHFDKHLDWTEAKASACSFKGIDENSDFANQTLELARSIEVTLANRLERADDSESIPRPAL